MLVMNRKHPPRTLFMADVHTPGSASVVSSFVSAEDFDHTGILVGVDPCASSYWWFPELHALPVEADGLTAHATGHATQRTGVSASATVRSTSAASAA